ncbi:unnamed protein product, partial [Phaeothamnion confervicola]
MQLPSEEGGGEARVLYAPDENADMFQLGRLQCSQNDFVVRGPLHQSKTGKVCGPVSRYALRITCARDGPDRGTCRLFAGGFGANNAISLPYGSGAGPRWRAPAALGGWDATTTFGVRLWKPETGRWLEVTVNGALHEPRTEDLAVLGPHCKGPGEDNLLTDGSVVDVGGVQLLFESAACMAHSAAARPDAIIERLQRLRPQCPVMMHTIRFDSWHSFGDVAAATAATASGYAGGGSGSGSSRADAAGGAARAPWIFPACGHVHTFAAELVGLPCPLCRKPGPFTPALFQWLPAVDSAPPTVVFNPCGHVASEPVARFWSTMLMPNNAPPDAVLRPVCPHCAKPLRNRPGEPPYSRIVW